MAAMVMAAHTQMCGGEFATFFNDENRADILRGLFSSYYINSNQTVFDTNRSWTGRLPLLTTLFPKSRMICCVRELSWIVDSLERQLAKHPLQLSMMYGYKPDTSVYSRVEMLMNPESGLIGTSWSSLNEAWFGELAKRLIVIPYDHLATDPKSVISRLYAELGMEPFEHDFDNVSYSESEFDQHIGMPGLHDVAKEVTFTMRQPSIPPDLFNKYNNTAFWKSPDLNPRGVTVL